jgi:hypothetical protein
LQILTSTHQEYRSPPLLASRLPRRIRPQQHFHPNVQSSTTLPRYANFRKRCSYIASFYQFAVSTARATKSCCGKRHRTDAMLPRIHRPRLSAHSTCDRLIPSPIFPIATRAPATIEPFSIASTYFPNYQPVPAILRVTPYPFSVFYTKSPTFALGAVGFTRIKYGYNT